jgi:hypothetical protein
MASIPQHTALPRLAVHYTANHLKMKFFHKKFEVLRSETCFFADYYVDPD